MIFVVGPNNGGKSTFLREIGDSLLTTTKLKWLAQVDWDRGSSEQFEEFKATSLLETGDPHNLTSHLGKKVHRAYLDEFHQIGKISANQTYFLVHVLNAHERIKAADPAEAIDLSQAVSKHPYHQFYFDREAEVAFGDKIRLAFGCGFCVNRTGSKIGGHLGEAPSYDETDIVSYERSIFENMRPLSDAGDGVRCYAGILLNLYAKGPPVVTLDEPEAFLHPPQARRLGLELALATAEPRQIFVATHSVEILQGALAASVHDIHIVYVDHTNTSRPAFLVKPSDVEEFAKNPFLSTTGALDAIFYSQAIICEGEPDILFYRWALSKTAQKDHTDDWLWVSSYGKSYMPHMLESLAKLGVTAKCVLDIDALLTPEILKRICFAKGYDLTPELPLLRQLRNSIKVPPAHEVLSSIERQLTEISGVRSDSEISDAISSVRRTAESLGKSWALKRAGLSILPSGDLYARVDDLLNRLKSLGVIILREGEMENYAKEVGGHGQRWVQAVVESNSLSQAAIRAICQYFD
jgi:hypothetical protein